jgi:regulator of sigma E protease
MLPLQNFFNAYKTIHCFLGYCNCITRGFNLKIINLIKDMDVLMMIFQLLLSLSILVLLHEGGHFIAAKLFKTKVEKFYLFFNPWFTPFKVKIGETEYGIGWLPLGGYVKIAGMIDESFDKEQMRGEVQPWEFRAKPAWQRLIIMLGGIIINILLGIVIFIALTYAYGKTYLKNESVTTGIHVDSLGYKLGLRDGDKILSLGEKAFDKFDVGSFSTTLILDEVKTIKVIRDGNEVDVPVPADAPSMLAKSKDNFIFIPRIPFKIDQITEGSIAEKAGFKKDDRILAVNSVPALWDYEVREKIKRFPNKKVEIKIVRNESDTLSLTATLGTDAKLGIAPYLPDHFFKITTENYTLLQAIPKGITRSWDFVAGQVRAFGKIFQGKIKATESVGSVISMGKMFGGEWNVQKFWTLTAMLSLLLAFLNLLPIPGLDGGHAVFAIYEIVTGRKPSDKVVEYATTVGFVILVALMIFALGNDIRRLF